MRQVAVKFIIRIIFLYKLFGVCEPNKLISDKRLYKQQNDLRDLADGFSMRKT